MEEAPVLHRQRVDAWRLQATQQIAVAVEASFVVNSMYNNKSILGCRYGATRPHHDIPLYIDYYLDGRFLLDEMVSKQYDVADVESALADLEAGKLNRGVLDLV